jgi:hypothetical protein
MKARSSSHGSRPGGPADGPAGSPSDRGVWTADQREQHRRLGWSPADVDSADGRAVLQRRRSHGGRRRRGRPPCSARAGSRTASAAGVVGAVDPAISASPGDASRSGISSGCRAGSKPCVLGPRVDRYQPDLVPSGTPAADGGSRPAGERPAFLGQTTTRAAPGAHPCQAEM